MTTLDNLLKGTGLDLDTGARVAWSTVAEPGNQAAGRLIKLLGAESAFTTVVDTTNTEHTGIEELREQVLARLRTTGVEKAVAATLRYDMEIITPDHPNWPTQLNELGDGTPFALWARGDANLLNCNRMTAIVGARAATGYGEHVTMEISAGLVERDHTIISGAGYGIDGMAHRATLASEGSTIAVLAGGLDRFYPSGHDALLTRIADSGLIVGETPPSTPPTKWRFLQRNRVIAALAHSTVVTEAGYRSGSLNTAGHALGLGRPVGAVPGPITSAASAGTHRLIRFHHAALVTSAEEVDALTTTTPVTSNIQYQQMIRDTTHREFVEQLAQSESYPSLVRTLNQAALHGVDIRDSLEETIAALAAKSSDNGDVAAELNYRLLTGPLSRINSTPTEDSRAVQPRPATTSSDFPRVPKSSTERGISIETVSAHRTN